MFMAMAAPPYVHHPTLKWHYDNAYKEFTYNEFTYDITYLFLFTVISKVTYKYNQL